MSDNEIAKAQREELEREFMVADLVIVMAQPEGRKTIAMILELCLYESSAFAKNATEIAANVAKQEIAHKLKDMAWEAGGKSLWRRMEDEVEARIETVNDAEEDALDDDPIADALSIS